MSTRDGEKKCIYVVGGWRDKARTSPQRSCESMIRVLIPRVMGSCGRFKQEGVMIGFAF